MPLVVPEALRGAEKLSTAHGEEAFDSAEVQCAQACLT